jgi:hypothetical protein
LSQITLNLRPVEDAVKTERRDERRNDDGNALVLSRSGLRLFQPFFRIVYLDAASARRHHP